MGIQANIKSGQTANGLLACFIQRSMRLDEKGGVNEAQRIPIITTTEIFAGAFAHFEVEVGVVFSARVPNGSDDLSTAHFPAGAYPGRIHMRKEALDIAGFFPGAVIVDHPDHLSPATTVVLGVKNDPICGSIDIISKVRISPTRTIPIFAEVLQSFRQKATELVIVLGIGRADREVEAITRLQPLDNPRFNRWNRIGFPIALSPERDVGDFFFELGPIGNVAVGFVNDFYFVASEK